MIYESTSNYYLGSRTVEVGGEAQIGTLRLDSQNAPSETPRSAGRIPPTGPCISLHACAYVKLQALCLVTRE